MTQDQTFAAVLRAAEIPNAERLAALATRSLRITTTRAPESSLGLGASRFGGCPDVPLAFAWPERDGRPLAFLAQLDLSALPASSLPNVGWLLFFYEVDEGPYEHRPYRKPSWWVSYVDSPRAQLRRMSHPALRRDDIPFVSCAVSVSERVDLPHWDDRLLIDAGCTFTDDEKGDDDVDRYDAISADLMGIDLDAEGLHHMLGLPQQIQGDMRGQCQLEANRIVCACRRDYVCVRCESLLHECSSQWTLLMQIDTDLAGPGWMWGDCGRLYFWIRPADLAARAFERSWLVMQCS